MHKGLVRDVFSINFKLWTAIASASNKPAGIKNYKQSMNFIPHLTSSLACNSNSLNVVLKNCSTKKEIDSIWQQQFYQVALCPLFSRSKWNGKLRAERKKTLKTTMGTNINLNHRLSPVFPDFLAFGVLSLLVEENKRTRLKKKPWGKNANQHYVIPSLGMKPQSQWC